MRLIFIEFIQRQTSYKTIWNDSKTIVNLRLDFFIGGHFLNYVYSIECPIRTTKKRPRQLNINSKRPTTGSLDITGDRLKVV